MWFVMGMKLSLKTLRDSPASVSNVWQKRTYQLSPVVLGQDSNCLSKWQSFTDSTAMSIAFFDKQKDGIIHARKEWPLNLPSVISLLEYIQKL